jgi:hypothetical protein
MRSFAKYYCGGQIKDNEIGRACITYWGSEKYTRTHAHTQTERVSSGRSRNRWDYNIKLCFKKYECYVVNWINMAQDIAQWRALVNMIINLGVR